MNITKVVEGLTAENHRTRLSINRLSRAIEAIKLCPHRNSCPVSSELSLDEDDDNPGRGKGGKGQRRKQTDHDKNNVDGKGATRPGASDHST